MKYVVQPRYIQTKKDFNTLNELVQKADNLTLKNLTKKDITKMIIYNNDINTSIASDKTKNQMIKFIKFLEESNLKDSVNIIVSFKQREPDSYNYVNILINNTQFHYFEIFTIKAAKDFLFINSGKILN